MQTGKMWSWLPSTHNGGDIRKKIAVLQEKEVDVVHLSSCIRGKDPNYAQLAQQLSEHFAVVGYTHGDEIGKSGQAIVLAKAASCAGSSEELI